MSGQNPDREELIRRDAEELKRLGYAQQLFREMGGFAKDWLYEKRDADLPSP